MAEESGQAVAPHPEEVGTPIEEGPAAEPGAEGDGKPPDEGVQSSREAVAGGSSYGFPAGLWRALERHRPPGMGRSRLWRSPLRGPWLTSVFGLVLLAGLPIVIITGLLSYIAYGPRFGQAFPPDVGWLHLPYFDWPTRPSWLYRLNQGVHVGLGLVLIPVVLAKLWSVVPRLFSWPPARSMAEVVERASLLLLVGGILFEIVTGVLNIQYDYVFGFSFYTAHYFGAWVFLGAFLVHVVVKLPRMLRALRSRSFRAEMRTSRAQTRPEAQDADGLVAAEPAEATLSRRGALLLVGGGALAVAAVTAGQTIDGIRSSALLLPRGRSYGLGANDFQINRTAAAAAINPGDIAQGWRLALTGGPHLVALDRASLLALPQHTAALPIACVEGWSTLQTWSGVRLRDLASLAGVPHPRWAHVRSLEQVGAFNQAMLQANQVLDPDSLLALRVNGVDLALDHGFPARIIAPAVPGVHNTKWVQSIEFRGG
ncbi:molybdopterin-dependent oxidoreductase [Saccharopolyspora phatthalungensis]|uniref:DMSO/TMAO reductase YedYZ molybdopterin-dependent catalytic subunit n=1 Tax=Saccharopolyspora phatthalungensis TaxID=664693 RepID=A0A840Q8R7_9PSEU|nr:molybdopterin-dependent oxidoreductase [Saccharopolyspora phatthalungensis]MBB5157144.1 DMSO/TMAO reductase YedYZ molybdopterin-dependent catalytic subunit [Saccharopolyspora phatthalungensis]